jgi:LytS/YehU family sensor histidine kinase
VFKVKAANNDGVWNSDIASVKIHIQPPFWQTSWFFTMVSFITAAMVVGFYKYRVGQIRKQEKVKTQYNKQIAEAKMTAFRAQMNPHFLFNCLNSINRYILKKDPMIASEYLTKFSKLMRQILDNSKDATISLENELTALKLYIQLEALRFENKFDFKIEVDDEVTTDYIQIPPLLLQPYVENAIWHGLMHKKEGQPFLLIQLQIKDEYLECIIEDNGVGRVKALELKSKSATQNKSMGMQITSERITLMKIVDPGSRKNPVRIIDLKNESGEPRGTRVELQIPL